MQRLEVSGAVRPLESSLGVKRLNDFYIECGAERTPLFEKRINSKPKKIWKCYFYFRKAHGMPFYINVFQTKHHSSGDLEYF